MLPNPTREAQIGPSTDLDLEQSGRRTARARLSEVLARLCFWCWSSVELTFFAGPDGGTFDRVHCVALRCL